MDLEVNPLSTTDKDHVNHSHSFQSFTKILAFEHLSLHALKMFAEERFANWCFEII